MTRKLSPLESPQVRFVCRFSAVVACETPRLADRKEAEGICLDAIQCTTRRYPSAAYTINLETNSFFPAAPRVVFSRLEKGETLDSFADHEESKTLLFGEYSSGWHIAFCSDTEMFVSLRITHATCDGPGTVYLMTSFLRYLNAGTSPDQIETLPLRDPHTMIRRPTAAPDENFPEPQPRRLPGNGKTHKVLRHCFEAGASEALVDAARKHGATVQGCFNALVSYAVTPLFPSDERRPLVLGNPKQLRDLMEDDEPPVASDEVIVGPSNLLLPTPLVTTKADLWPTAEGATHELKRQIRCDVPRWNIKKMEEGWDFNPLFSVLSTTFGRFVSECPSGPEAFRLTDCFFSKSFAPEAITEDLETGCPEFEALTVDGLLCFSLFFSPEVIAEADAKRCVDRVIEGTAFMSQTA